MLVWISSDSAEQQAVRNENHVWESEEANNHQHKRRDEVEGGRKKRQKREKKTHKKTRQELRKKFWTIFILGSKEEEI